MTAIPNISARMAFACILVVACASCDAAGDVSGVADELPEGAVQVVDRLPLRPGYYVAADTPCEQASNATLHLLSEDGDGYGGFTTPPYFCTFQRIEQTGPSSYRAVESCGSSYGDGDDHVIAVAYEILDDASYRAKNDDGWESSARRCPRQQLPALWRDSGPGGFVD